MNRRIFVTGSAATIAILAGTTALWRMGRPLPAQAEAFEVTKTDDEWRAVLNAAQYAVLRQEHTERPGTSPLLMKSARACSIAPAAISQPIRPKPNTNSGTGWPSFWDSLPGAIGTKEDTSLFMMRVEVHCRRCGGHFGHIFDDGPEPTGKRHCLNGLALTFKPATAVEALSRR